MDPEDYDKKWASKYLLDPLTEPQPGQETGPGTHFTSTFARKAPSEASSTPTITDRKKPAEIKVQRKPSSVRDVNFRRLSAANSSKDAYPTPPASASPRSSQFPRRNSTSSSPRSPNSNNPYRQSGSITSSPKTPKSANPYRQEAFSGTGGRRRGSSLGERYPGDQSHRPLDMLKRSEKNAHRAPHMRKHHQIGVDVIDNLDNVGGSKYHHEGPFDAAYYARNTSFNSSPLEALSWSNKEALKATPKERILDSTRGHRPLDGVASYPPGTSDRLGNKYEYTEGANQMTEDGGDYKRWPGVKYLDGDVKGKGEPSYTLEKALKANKESHRRVMSDGIEMTTRPSSSAGENRRAHSGSMGQSVWNDTASERTGGLRRSSTTGGKLRKRFGSLTHRHRGTE